MRKKEWGNKYEEKRMEKRTRDEVEEKERGKKYEKKRTRKFQINTETYLNRFCVLQSCLKCKVLYLISMVKLS